MEWEIQEFICELELDGERKVLFVEGNADIVLWRSLIPEFERINIVVYPIGVIRVVSNAGERGRLIEFAREIMRRGLQDRVRFFADADFDRLLQRPVPENVALTDGRDRESYLLLCSCLAEICCHDRSPDEAARELQDFLDSTAGSMAVLRVASEKLTLNLPFQKTLERGVGRFMDRRTSRFDSDGFKQAVFQNGPGIRVMRDIQGDIDRVGIYLESIPAHEKLHGRDLLLLLAWRNKWEIPAAEQIVSMALRAQSSRIAAMPNVSGILEWSLADRISA